MPIYEYQCQVCGHGLERLQKVNDAPLVTCPECGKEGLVRKVSAPSFQLKGGGWYVTDFKNSGKKPVEAGKEAGKVAEGGDSGAKDSGKASDKASGEAEK